MWCFVALRHDEFVEVARRDGQFVEEGDVVFLEIEVGSVLGEEVVERGGRVEGLRFRAAIEVVLGDALVVEPLSAVGIRQQFVRFCDLDEAVARLWSVRLVGVPGK